MFAIPPEEKMDSTTSKIPSIMPATRLPPTRDIITVKTYFHQLLDPSEALSKNVIGDRVDIVFSSKIIAWRSETIILIG